MNMPYWVDEEFKLLYPDFTGAVAIECYRGGVTRIDTKTSRKAPAVQSERHTLNALNIAVAPIPNPRTVRTAIDQGAILDWWPFFIARSING